MTNNHLSISPSFAAVNPGSPVLQQPDQKNDVTPVTDAALAQMYSSWGQYSAEAQTNHNAAQAELTIMREKIKQWPSGAPQDQTNSLLPLIGRLANHQWKIMGGVTGTALAGSIAKTLLCWSWLGCVVSSLSGMVLGALVCSRFDKKTN